MKQREDKRLQLLTTPEPTVNVYLKPRWTDTKKIPNVSNYDEGKLVLARALATVLLSCR